MTGPVVKSIKLGPGTLTIGPVGTPQEFSVQTQACALNPDKNKEDDQPMLSGDVAAGATTYTYSLAGTLRQDLDNPSGVSAYTYTHAGEEQPFDFVPNTAAGATVSGILIVDPTTIGGDNAGDVMTADFEFSVVGMPTVNFGP